MHKRDRGGDIRMITERHYNLCFRCLLEFTACLVLFLCPAAYAQQQASVAEIVHLNDTVEVFAKRNKAWGPATRNQLLYEGDAVRTGDPGLAVILTSDGSGIHINRNTRFVLKEVASTAPWLKVTIKRVKSIYQLFPWKSGKPAEAAIENDNGHVEIEVETATVKAGIRGTSMVLEVLPEAAGETSIVSVLEGTVEVTALTGPRDSLIAGSAEQVIAERGRPLLRRPLTLSPADTVQWTLFIPPLLPGTATPRVDPSYARALNENTRLLQNGQLIKARVGLLDLTRRVPDNSAGYQLLAVTMLALNEKESALDAAQKAVDSDPHSPSAAIVLSYVYQAMFELGKAREETERALVLDPEYALALINLARLQFGEDDVNGAWNTLKKAQELAPEEAEIYNLRGFILLARRETQAAVAEFSRAIELNGQLGEPRLGLGLAYMRQGDTEAAFKEIATAVVLDPQRSLFRSYWGKMLHQVKRFDKALEVLERARKIDPNDPTPEYYRAIILRDLNRPGEAIGAFNHAVELNDNRAVFRSRFLLDKDLASRNVDLAILYNELGLGAWAKNKALASIKRDYANFEGHLFYQGVLFQQEGRSYTATSEALLTRMLQPANVNTFNNFNNYTSLFEKPDTQGTLEGVVGNDDTYGGNAEVFGAVPRQKLAYSAGGGYDHTDGWRDINFEKAKNAAGIVKWEPTPSDGMFASASWLDAKQGDAIFPRFEADSPRRPDDRLKSTVQRFELGYHHRFAPASSLLLYGTYLDNDPKLTLLDPVATTPGGTVIDEERRIDTKNPFTLGQGHYTFRVSDHQILLGSLQMRGESRARDTTTVVLSGGGQVQRLPLFKSKHTEDTGYQSYYLQDIWGPSDWLTIEAAAYYDKIDNANAIEGTNWSVDGFDPRLGLIVTPTARDTVRLAAFRYILPFISPRLDPTDVAGIQIFRNTREGSRNKEYAASWEHKWGKSVFTELNLFHLDKSFRERRIQGGQEIERTQGGRISGLELEYNQLLTNRTGLLGSYRYLDVDDDNDPFQSDPLSNVNRKEHLFRVGLRYVRPDGISAGVTQTVRHINNDNIRSDETAAITDLALSYQLPQRRGLVKFEVLNLFDDSFNWVTDRFVLQGRAPTRQLLFTLTLNM